MHHPCWPKAVSSARNFEMTTHKEDQDRNDKEGDLDGTADCNSEREVELPFCSDGDCSDMLIEFLGSARVV